MAANQATVCGPFRQKVLQSSREGGDRFAHRLRLFWRRGVARTGRRRGGLSSIGRLSQQGAVAKDSDKKIELNGSLHEYCVVRDSECKIKTRHPGGLHAPI
jgi:hypothetical protein